MGKGSRKEPFLSAKIRQHIRDKLPYLKRGQPSYVRHRFYWYARANSWQCWLSVYNALFTTELQVIGWLGETDVSQILFILSELPLVASLTTLLFLENERLRENKIKRVSLTRVDLSISIFN